LVNKFDFRKDEDDLYPEVQVVNIDKIVKNDDRDMEVSVVSSSYPTISNKYFYHKSKQKLMGMGQNHQPIDKLSRSSFMSNGTFDQFKFE
jgi:hypothetical protein